MILTLLLKMELRNHTPQLHYYKHFCWSYYEHIQPLSLLKQIIDDCLVSIDR